MTLTEAQQLIEASKDAARKHVEAVDRFMETESDEDYRVLCDAEQAKSYAEYMAGSARTHIRRLQAVTCSCGRVWERGSTISPCNECS